MLQHVVVLSVVEMLSERRFASWSRSFPMSCVALFGPTIFIGLGWTSFRVIEPTLFCDTRMCKVAMYKSRGYDPDF